MDAVRLRRVNRRQAQELSGKLTDLYLDCPRRATFARFDLGMRWEIRTASPA